MKCLTLTSALLAAAVTADPTPTTQQPPTKRAGVPAVSASGNAFWTGKDRFYIRGLDYQPGGSSQLADPLAEPDICKRDIAQFKKLGINVIRVYSVDNSVSHDECMTELAKAGIYLILDVNNPLYSINRNNPAESYNGAYLQSVFATIDQFVKYDNTLAFFSGNEVVNDLANTTLAAPYVKATTRDMRQYIRNRGYRTVPVGYSAADVSQNRMQLAKYFNCGPDDERSDLFAFNDYSWCSTSFQVSGWDQKVQNFTGYGLPLFLSEYGCIKNTRDFGEVEALMSSQMTSVYSGGLVYEYSEEGSGYGLVTISGNSITEKPDFAAYASALAKNPAPQGSGGASATSNSVDCPLPDADWLVKDDTLPAIPEGAKKYMTEGAGPGPGLKGPGSQNAGGTSSGPAQPGSGAATGTGGSSPHNSGNAGAGGPGPMDTSVLVVTGVVCLMSLLGTRL